MIELDDECKIVKKWWLKKDVLGYNLSVHLAKMVPLCI